MSATTDHYIAMDTPNTAKFASDAPKLTLQWNNLTLRASIKNPKTKTVDEKIILNNVNGYAKPGELVVIMGPSGAGKSSLLDCIAGRNPNAEGSITVNGMPWSKSMKRLTSYVMQDDLFYETITVREHLLFQAKLRMGKTHSVQQYTERVDTVMEELGLMKTRDTLIGGSALRGISGGERKRLSFATEILTNPSMLFVDEPTSGLDSFMAETVVLQLQQIARDGRTVIATIHQPSSEIFALFDKLYLLSDGATVYHSKASESTEYFGSLGYQCPPFLNPSDYFMRQLVVVDKDTDTAGVERLEGLKAEWTKRSEHQYAQYPSDGAAILSVTQDADDTVYDTARLGVLAQMCVLATRNIVRILRDQIAFHAVVFETLFTAIVVGLVYLQLDMNQKGVQNFAGVLFFTVINMTFAAATPIFSAVPLELPLVLREYKSGLYRLFSWFLSKNLSELPLEALMPIIFFVPVYLLVGFGGDFTVFLYMQILLILTNSCAAGLGYMVACLTRRVDIAPIIGMVTILPFVLFGGLFVNSDDVPVYFVWLQYISPLKYGFEGAMKVFWGQVATIACNEAVENCAARVGTDVLRNYSMGTHSPFVDGLYLVVINLAFRTVGFLGLLFSVQDKSS